jgi:2-polyprenyl-3-methyl-5-hydroxy-6-metoxy-1,4-benzoquinol methylase
MLEARTSCPACGARDNVTLLECSYAAPEVLDFLFSYYHRANPDSIRNRLGNGTLTILECTHCRLIYQRNVPDREFMRELYDEWVIEDDYLAPTSKPLPVEYYTYLVSEVAHLLTEQLRIVGPHRRIRVLDFGMGWSAWLQVARSLGAEVYGTELSEAKIAYARSIGIPVLTGAQIHQLEFDLICTEQVLEHVPNPAELLQELVRSLAPSGYMKISVPPGRSVKAVLARWNWENAFVRQEALMPVHPLEHINCFTTQSLNALAARFGLQRAPLSALRAIAFSIGWHTPKAAVKNLLRPVYRFALKRGTYAVFRHR